jgi:rsbT co-antagonist protein RsbR
MCMFDINDHKRREQRQRERAAWVILDITGVPIVDTQVANALVRAAHSVRLLGAQVALEGVLPQVAQTLVGLRVDRRSIVTRGILRDGIAHAHWPARLMYKDPRP